MKTILLSATAGALMLAAPAFANCSRQGPSASAVHHEVAAKPARAADSGQQTRPVYQQFAGHGHEGGSFQAGGDY